MLHTYEVLRFDARRHIVVTPTDCNDIRIISLCKLTRNLTGLHFVIFMQKKEKKRFFK